MKFVFEKFQHISRMYLVSGGIFFLGLLLLIIIFFLQPTRTVEDIDTVVDEIVDVVDGEECDYPRYLDGVCMASERLCSSRTVGVMIENHFDARPLSGLGSASVVYEAPVEGNYNRFLALFPEDTDVKKVGPVRSARPYFLDWVSEYPGTMYMHVGGSPQALDDIVRYGLFDLNEFYRGWYYWRDNARYAPHNVYTSSDLWAKAIDDYAEDEEQEFGFEPWQFEAWDQCEEDCVYEIVTTYSGSTYEATWQYNTSTEQYERYELGKKVLDKESGDPIVADTLIVQYVDTTVLDDVGRLGMDTIGRGEAVVFRNGFKVEGEWRKEQRTERTEFFDFDEEGQEIPLKAGKIWIAVMNGTGDVVYE